MAASSETEPSELLDVVDATGVWLGTATRAEVHAKGLWHNVFHCLIARSNDPARVVLQRRHSKAKGFPNKIDFSATGHLVAGEKPIDGIRELAEELGVIVEPSQLVEAGVRLLADDSGEGRNRERIHLFFLTDDRPLDAFEPSHDEVSGLVEIEIGQLLRLVENYFTDPTTAAPITEWSLAGTPVASELLANELVPPADSYWVTALIAAQRYAQNERPLGI